MEAKEKSNLLAVDVVVIDEKVNVLLRKRTKEPDAGKWELFGGYPYLDELPLEKAALRILKEKADIDEGYSLTFTGKFYDNPARHPGTTCVPLVFVATVSDPVENTDDKRWFSPSEIKELPMALDNKTIILEFLSDK